MTDTSTTTGADAERREDDAAFVERMQRDGLTIVFDKDARGNLGRTPATEDFARLLTLGRRAIGAPGDESTPWPLSFVYRNYRGEVAERRAYPISVRWGSTEWHPEPQWLMLAFDPEKGAEREFAMDDMSSVAPSDPTAAVSFVRDNVIVADTKCTEEHALKIIHGMLARVSPSYRAGMLRGAEIVAQLLREHEFGTVSENALGRGRRTGYADAERAIRAEADAADQQPSRLYLAALEVVRAFERGVEDDDRRDPVEIDATLLTNLMTAVCDDEQVRS